MAAPLVPPDVSLPRLPWVPIYGMRLFDSTFFAVATPAEFRAGFCLWIKSWQQSPPGSLPSDDRELCRLAELGGNLGEWKKVKRIALRHWTRCDDGRLYHPVVAELVLDASDKLTKGRKRTAAASEARWAVRNGVRNGNDLESEIERKSPPKSPPRNGGDHLPMNGGRGAPAPIDPKILGHTDPCHCANCVRWNAAKGAA